MPFDGVTLQDRLQIFNKMDKVIDLLADERRWIKHLRSHDGRYCIRGAIELFDGQVELKKHVALAIRQVTGRNFLHIEHFNDHALTTHALVMAVLQQARENIATGTPPTMKRVHSLARLRQAFL